MRNKVIHIVLDFLFPRICAGCDEPGTLICDKCRKESAFLGNECLFCGVKTSPACICEQCRARHHIEMATWPWRYSEPKARKIISVFKYRRKKALASELALILKEKILAQSFPTNFFVVPMPLSREKLRERGFNQTELIAEHLGYPTLHCLTRTKHTAPQARAASRAERLRQIGGAFQALNPTEVHGKHILLIDDVSTTGATLSEAAKILKSAGAGKIYAAIIAHG